MSDHVITPTDFKDYADHFGLIADSGAQSYKMLYNSITLMQNVDETSFTNNTVGSHPTEVKTVFEASLKSSLNFIKSQAINTSVMNSLFVGLSKHIKKWTGKDINTYLNNNNIDVNNLYTGIANFFGESIQ